MSVTRRSFTGEQKVAILREHLIDRVPVSEVCEKHGLQPKLFYNWQKTFFENGATAFEKGPGKKEKKRQERVAAAMERKLQKKDEVLAELMEEHIALKKSLGEL